MLEDAHLSSVFAFVSCLDVRLPLVLFLGESLCLAALLAVLQFYYNEALLLWEGVEEGRAIYNH